MAELDRVRPRDGWRHIGCPDCGLVSTFPSRRLDEGDEVFCPHIGSTIVWGSVPEEHWTRMVPVLVLPTDALIPPDVVERAWQAYAWARFHLHDSWPTDLERQGIAAAIRVALHSLSEGSGTLDPATGTAHPSPLTSGEK